MLTGGLCATSRLTGCSDRGTRAGVTVRGRITGIARACLRRDGTQNQCSARSDEHSFRLHSSLPGSIL
jgi:hypothetical protein